MTYRYTEAVGEKGGEGRTYGWGSSYDSGEGEKSDENLFELHVYFDVLRTMTMAGRGDEWRVGDARAGSRTEKRRVHETSELLVGSLCRGFSLSRGLEDATGQKMHKSGSNC